MFLSPQFYTKSSAFDTRLVIFDNNHNIALCQFPSQSSNEIAQYSTDSSTTAQARVTPVSKGVDHLSIHAVDKYMHSELRDCDQAVVFAFDTATHPLAIHISAENPAGSISVTEINLMLGGADTFLYHSLCPATGRMVFVTDTYDVHVVDYIGNDKLQYQ